MLVLHLIFLHVYTFIFTPDASLLFQFSNHSCKGLIKIHKTQNKEREKTKWAGTIPEQDQLQNISLHSLAQQGLSLRFATPRRSPLDPPRRVAGRRHSRHEATTADVRTQCRSASTGAQDPLGPHEARGRGPPPARRHPPAAGPCQGGAGVGAIRARRHQSPPQARHLGAGSDGGRTAGPTPKWRSRGQRPVCKAPRTRRRRRRRQSPPSTRRRR